MNLFLKQSLLYPAGIREFEGEDILPISKRLLRHWGTRIHFHKGRIENLGWSGECIEVLVVDALKDCQIVDKITSEFYPSLQPGCSLLVHQDFFHWRQPWLVAQMAALAEAFKPIGMAEDHTMVFLCNEKVDAELLQKAKVNHLTDKQILRALDFTKCWLKRFNVADRLETMSAAVKMNPGVRIAWEMLNCPKSPIGN